MGTFGRNISPGLQHYIDSISVGPPDNYFDDITPEKAWVLGLLWSDGCLTRSTRISYYSSDLELAEDVARILGYRGEVRKYRENYTVRFSSKPLAGVLRTMGFTERKSTTKGWPVKLPRETEADFVRGYFDGNGTIQYNYYKGRRVTFYGRFDTGSERFARSLNEWCEAREMLPKLYCWGKGKYWRVQVATRAGVKQLVNVLYHSPDVPRLWRKYEPLKVYGDRKPDVRTNAPTSQSE